MSIIIKGELADLNTYIAADKNNRYSGGRVKKSETSRVCREVRVQKVPPVPKAHYPVSLLFRWYSKDNRKDIDNVAFAKKFILDGLVLARVLENDSRKFVNGFTDEFFIDKSNPRVEIEII